MVQAIPKVQPSAMPDLTQSREYRLPPPYQLSLITYPRSPTGCAWRAHHPPSLIVAVSHHSLSPTLSDITKVLDLGQTLYIDIDPHLANTALYSGAVHIQKVHATKAILRLRFWATLGFGTFSAPLRLL